MWKTSLSNDATVPSPNGHGWKISYDTLDFVWMTQRPAPDSMLELITCSCRRQKCPGSCQCVIHGLLCTELCNCSGECDNHNDEQMSEDDASGEKEDDAYSDDSDMDIS